jgi:hypothetical protein
MTISKCVHSLSVLLVLAALLASESVAMGAPTATFPLKESANGRYLVGNNDVPFFINGDSSWSLIANLSKGDARRYLDDRQRHGFNAVFANLIENTYSTKAPSNLEGEAPFTTPGDFSTPNPDYFDHAAWVIERAQERGIVVWAVPAYMGFGGPVCDSDGWWNEIISNGPRKNRNYGRYLGNRFKRFPNIVWMHGGDCSPASGSEAETNALEILKGIEDSNPVSRFHTFHGRRTVNGVGTTSLDQVNFAPYLNLNGVYIGDEHNGASRVGEAYTVSLRAYNQPNLMPHYLIEGRYECAASDSSQCLGQPHGPRERLRRQAYWAILSGGAGHFFGNHAGWSFGSFCCGAWDGPEGIGSPGNQDAERLGRFFTSHAWHKLVPDQNHATVTAGYGTYAGADYVTTGRAEDGSLIMAYVPATGTGTRTLTVNMAQLSGVATARWFNPTSGVYTTISGSPFVNSGSTDFTIPGDNGTGKNDWVLVLQTQ